MRYNGGTVVAMAGKNCVAIATDKCMIMNIRSFF
jgi:20S proteasome alpha/beta subunit